MKRKMILALVCMIALMTGCNTQASNEKGKNEGIASASNGSSANQEALEQKISELEAKLDANEKEREYFTAIVNLSKHFIKAHSTGDKETLKFLISNDLSLEEKENKLFIHDADGEWQVYSDERKLDDWIIQGFQYQPETETYLVHLREFYVTQNGEPESPPTFLNLTLKQIDGEWKVTGLSFDV